MAALLRGTDAPTATALVGDVLREALARVQDRALERDAGEQARLDALVQIYAERDAIVSAPAELAGEVAVASRRGRDGSSLGPVARDRAGDLLALLQLEQGLWQDRAVDLNALDALRVVRDERTLRWAGARLPDGVLRDEARRRVVRLHVEASPLAEVRSDAAAVEDAVMRTGANPVSLARHPPVRGWVDPAVQSARSVVVEQRLPEQSARLLAPSVERPAPSLIPELPLRGNVHIVLEGLSTAVTVCAPAEELDPTPCLAAADVRVDAPVATLDRQGVLHFADSMPEAAAVELAYQGRALVVPFTVAGRHIASLEWPLSFARPANLVLAGARPGARGPDLDVRADGRAPGRVVYAVSDGPRQLQAVVEREDASAFNVVSRGARGWDGGSGSDGLDGAPGSGGWGATCPSSPGSSGSPGGNGSNGGDGGAGGPGGDGGDVRVSLRGTVGAQDGIVAVLQATIRSEGGAGGRGGSGGRAGSGGRGGTGGSGTTCWDAEGHTRTLSGGSDGTRGVDGLRGSDGPDGPHGRPGRVSFSSGE